MHPQVIFLDSDNVATLDPAVLLDSPEFCRTGVLLWPDYWNSMSASDLKDLLDIPRLPDTTFESGQMVFDKRRSALFLSLLTARDAADVA